MSFNFLCKTIFASCLAEKQRWDCADAAGVRMRMRMCVSRALAHITSSANTDAFLVYLSVCFRFFFILVFTCFSHCHEINVPYFPSMPANTHSIISKWKLNILQPHSYTHTVRVSRQAHAQAMRKAEITRTKLPFYKFKWRMEKK